MEAALRAWNSTQRPYPLRSVVVQRMAIASVLFTCPDHIAACTPVIREARASSQICRSWEYHTPVLLHLLLRHSLHSQRKNPIEIESGRRHMRAISRQDKNVTRGTIRSSHFMLAAAPSVGATELNCKILRYLAR